MAGQFSDTGSRYALEALTGRSTLGNSSGNQAIISAISANGNDVGANGTDISVTNYIRVTVPANALAGIFPGQYAVISGIAGLGATGTTVNGLVQVKNVNYSQNQFSFIATAATSATTGAAVTATTTLSAAAAINQNTITVTSTTNVVPGMQVVLANYIPAGTLVTGVAGSVVTLSNPVQAVAASAQGDKGIASGASVTFNAIVSFVPTAKPTYVALATAQPLDNNFTFVNSNGLPNIFQMQEYSATGYGRQLMTWSAATEPNAGSSGIFIGTGGTTLGGYTTTGPVNTPAPATNLTVTNIVVNGSTANPPYIATVTTSANQGVAVGDNVTIGGTWTGGTGTVSAGTYTVTAVTGPTTFTFGTNQTSAINPAYQGNATSLTASGTFTGGTVLLNAPYNTTFTTYNYATGTALAAAATFTPAAHGLVVGSTINIRGVWTSAGVVDISNATIVAVPSTTTFTIASQNVGTPVSTATANGAGATAQTSTWNVSTSINAATAGTVGTVAGAGTAASPWTATVTGLTSTAGLVVGQWVNGGANLYGGTPTAVYVTVVTSTSFNYAVIGGSTPVAGTSGSITALTVVPGVISGGLTGAATSAGTGFVTYIINNNFSAGDTVIVGGFTTPTSYNGVRQVYAANSSSFTVYDSTTTLIGLAGTPQATRLGAVTVGGLIQGPVNNTALNVNNVTFGPFTGLTGATITHAALVTTPSVGLPAGVGANTAVPTVSAITLSTPAAGYMQVTTSGAHGLAAGHTVRVDGLAPAIYNGVYPVLAIPTATTFIVAQANTTALTTSTGTLTGILNGELLAWWALDTPRTPAVNDQVTVSPNQLSLYVN